MKNNNLEEVFSWFCEWINKTKGLEFTLTVEENQQILLRAKTLDVDKIKHALKCDLEDYLPLDKFKINATEGYTTFLVNQKTVDYIAKLKEQIGVQTLHCKRKRDFDNQISSLRTKYNLLTSEDRKRDRLEALNPVKIRLNLKDTEKVLVENKRLGYINDQIKKIFYVQGVTENVKKELTPIINLFEDFESKVTAVELKELKRQVQESLTDLQKSPIFYLQKIGKSFEAMLLGDRDSEIIRVETKVDQRYNQGPK
jgi:hypothetical protein